ncbi:hypothetical protein [Desulfocurvus sp.]|jgi:hypothetical protein|uniref:hypothetical protein n=1 Tax=Desulfocurvus sp. TaxID=2871698 RepID=UPI0025BDC5EF|nr:hypothetical protein [Desulfocurvus sp.]MCK9239397.1 hypothetical protein [Desulfocurvus sp.]
MPREINAEKDPVTELYDVASALRFLEEALESHDETETQVRAGGAAYVTGLMGRRLTDLASALWEMESRPEAGRAACGLGASPDCGAACAQPD